MPVALTVPATYTPVLANVTTLLVPLTVTKMFDPAEGMRMLLVPFTTSLPVVATMPVSWLPLPIKYPAVILPVVVIPPVVLIPPVPR